MGTIERAEKQILLARHARRLLGLVDDTPIVPGDAHPVWEGTAQSQAARQVINDAEEDLRAWRSQEGELPGGAAGEGLLGVVGVSDSHPPHHHPSSATAVGVNGGGETGLVGSPNDANGAVKPLA